MKSDTEHEKTLEILKLIDNMDSKLKDMDDSLKNAVANMDVMVNRSKKMQNILQGIIHRHD